MFRRLARVAVVWLGLGSMAGGVFASSARPMDPAWVTRVWQLDDGLPGNEVTGVEQTADGYLWIGTPRGLVRFDGVRFQHIPLPGGDPLIRGMCQARDGHLWLALEGSLAVCLTPGFSNAATTIGGLSPYRPLAPVEDKDGAIWIGYSDGSAWRIQQGHAKQFSAHEGLTGVGYCRLAMDPNGKLWFAKAGRVGFFEDDKFKVQFTLKGAVVQIAPRQEGGIWVRAGARLYRYERSRGLVKLGELPKRTESGEPSVMYEDHLGTLWIGTSTSGLFRFDGSQISQVETSHEAVTSVREDREGCIWVGTAGGGLDRLLPRVLKLEDESIGLPFETVRSVCEDATGDLWAVGENGVVARQKNGVWTTLSTNAGLPAAAATCVAGDKQGTVWIGTYLGGLCRWQNGAVTSYKRENGLASDMVRSLFVDSRGDLWIGLESHARVQRLHQGVFDMYTVSADNPVRTIAEDTAGNIWLATSGGQLLRADTNQLVDETKHYHSPPRPIRCLCATADGSLWIGYAGAGVGRLRDGRLSIIGTGQGLYDDHICSMIGDGASGMWFASDRGIFQVRQSELDAVADGQAAQVFSLTYGRDQALPNLEANYGYMPGAARCHDGRLCFSMYQGLAVAQPSRVRPNAVPPPLSIERVMLDDRELNPSRAGGRLDLPPGDRNLEIDFTALSFVSPENIRFRHQLEGWDKGWEKEGPQRSATYSRLPPGNYTFRVMARNETSGWSKAAAVQLWVEPFLWQTWWFRALVVVVFGGLIAAAMRQHERRKHQRELEQVERHNLMERERTRVAQDLHDDLGAGLTEIGLLGAIAQRDNVSTERARQHLQQITGKAHDMVGALDEIVWAVNPKHDSVVSLSHYFCEYARHFFELTSIHCRMEVAKDLPARLLTSEQRHSLFLAFKEALTNVVRHARATEVWIKIFMQDQTLSVIVSDNGLGVGESADTAGNGLPNMLRRLEQINGRCEVKSSPRDGTAVHFTFPLPGQAVK